MRRRLRERDLIVATFDGFPAGSMGIAALY
jgi:hypothetical protein